MKKISIYLISIIMVLTSCRTEKELRPEFSSDVIYALIEDTHVTKTSMGPGNHVLWSSGDQLMVFNKSSNGSVYMIRDEFAGKNQGEFSFQEYSGESGELLDHIIAYYPYSEAIECHRSDDKTYEIMGASILAQQDYVKESFGPAALPMVAVSEDNVLAFMNICGALKLQLKGTQKIKHIKLEGKNEEKLSGSVTIRAYADGSEPSILLSDDAAKSVMLNCPEGVLLNENSATDFIMVLPPTEFTAGFRVTLTDSHDKTYTIETSKHNEIRRSSILSMPEIVLDESDMFNIWDGVIPENSPLVKNQEGYIIDEAADIAWLSIESNASVLEENSKFVLKANIDMAHMSGLQPIQLPAGSVLDGGNHMIKGLRQNGGLLGDVTGVSVKNLTIEHSEVTGSDAHNGILIDILRGSGSFSNVIVRNSTVTATAGAAGAMIGYIVRKNQKSRDERLEVVFDNCHVLATEVKGSHTEGHMVGLICGYDNGEVLTFKNNCSVQTTQDNLNSAYVEGNEGEWLSDHDYSKYNSWLGAEEYYRAKIFYGSDRYIPRWDGVTTVEPLLADPLYDDSPDFKVTAGTNRFVVYSAFDLVGVRAKTASPAAVFLKENVDLNGPGPDGKRWVAEEYGRSKQDSVDDQYLKAFTSIDYLDGQNHGIYNMCIRSFSEVNAAFIKGAKSGAQTVHKNLSFHNCQTVTPVIELKSGGKIQDASFGSILIDYTNPRDGGSYLMENIHAYDCRVFALQSAGILARQLESGTVRNCTVNDCYIENCKYERHLEPYEKSMEIAGNMVTVSTGFYSYGEIGGLFGFIQGGAEVSDCHVRGTTIYAFGQDDKDADITGSGFLGSIGAAVVQGMGYFRVPGRHVSTLVGDIRTYKGETITITGCTVDENTRCLQDYHKHNDAYPYIGQAYYIQFSDTKGQVIVDGNSLTLADCNRNTER